MTLYLLHCRWKSHINNTVGIEAENEEEAIEKLKAGANIEDLPEFEILAIHDMASMPPDTEMTLQ